MPQLSRFPDWTRIDTVLLDLDGTLLDLAFDNRLWMAEMPRRYAAARNLSLAAAQAELAPRFRRWRGKLEWYCIDFWSRELQLDVAALHREMSGGIYWLAGARDFLLALRRMGKRAVLCTNSHPAILALKHERTQVLDLLDAAYSSHPFGAPKEDPRFWQQLREREQFDPQRALFVDDSPTVLAAGARAGIAALAIVTEPDSGGGLSPYHDGDRSGFVPIRGVSDLLA